MVESLGTHRSSCLLAAMLAASAVSAYGQAGDATPVKKKLPADERAFKVARANVDPALRLAAMREFVKAYPKSNRVGLADYDILKILVDEYPRRKAELNVEIKLKLHDAGASQERVNTEEGLAFTLAEAGPAGIELAQAEAMEKDAVARMNEADYDKNTLATYAKYKVPAPKADELHKQFASSRAEVLATLGDVYLKEGKQDQAVPLIAEAYTLDGKSDTVDAQRGRLALVQHDDAVALASFEQAQLLGELKASDRESMMQLYRKAHGGSEEGFSAEMDARYEQLYPSPLTPGKPKEVTTGRTVLLELFTGSACQPCVGGDLAVEGLLEAYPRSELVALAFDQHIPDPDPLTNPDSAARADFYDVEHTPNFVVDGQLQELYGSNRENSKKLYDKLAAMVDAEAARQDGVGLKVFASASGGIVHARAGVTVPGAVEVAKELAAVPPSMATSSGEKAATPAPSASAPVTPSLVVNFALVEDGIRYSGENGVRFHRMVVRSLAKPADSGFPVSAGATANLEATFEPAAISRALVSYLDSYEEKNEKFGKIKFISKDMTMHPEHLMVAVWVQDAISHRILQTALVPVGGESARLGTE